MDSHSGSLGSSAPSRFCSRLPCCNGVTCCECGSASFMLLSHVYAGAGSARCAVRFVAATWWCRYPRRCWWHQRWQAFCARRRRRHSQLSGRLGTVQTHLNTCNLVFDILKLKFHATHAWSNSAINNLKLIQTCLQMLNVICMLRTTHCWESKVTNNDSQQTISLSRSPAATEWRATSGQINVQNKQSS